MDLTNLEILGLIAGAITSIGYLPQIYRGYKTKKLAVIVANIFGVACSILLIIMKKKYTKS